MGSYTGGAMMPSTTRTERPYDAQKPYDVRAPRTERPYEIGAYGGDKGQSQAPFAMVGNNPASPFQPQAVNNQMPSLQQYYDQNKDNPENVQKFMSANGYDNASAAKNLGIDAGYIDGYFQKAGMTGIPGNNAPLIEALEKRRMQKPYQVA